MRVDLGRKLLFPQVVQTSLRPNLVMWSKEAKKIILIELTVPSEDGCIKASEWKTTKYQDLVQSAKTNGGKSGYSQLTSCRGFPAQSVWRALTEVGWQGGRGRRLLAGLARQWRKPLVRYGVGGKN